MPSKPKVHHTRNIWEKYALALLAKNPEWWACSPNKRAKAKYEILYKHHKDPFTGKLEVMEVMSYTLFRSVLEDFFEEAKIAVIEGKAIDLTNKLGKIAGKRVERDHTKKKVDFPRTKKRPKVWDPVKQKMRPDKIIYQTDDEWCRINWYKVGGVTNETLYEFKPSGSTVSGIGFSQMFGRAQVENNTLKYRYPYFPWVPRKNYNHAVQINNVG